MNSHVEDFIRDDVEPRREQLNTWRRLQTQREILLDDAKRRRKISAKNMNGTHVLWRSGKVIGGIDEPYTTLVSQQARRATASRQVAKQYLRASEVPVLPGREFHVSQFNSAERFWSQIAPSAVAVKPASAGASPGTTLGITTSQEFHVAWDKAAATMAHLRPTEHRIDVEAHQEGLLLRIYVVGEHAVAAVVRIPLYVIGDGKSTVGDLLDAVLDARDFCRYLRARRPVIDNDFLSPVCLDRNNVLPADTLRVLTQEADVETGGGLSVDVLGKLDPGLVQLAVDAVWAFPNLGAAAVDILTTSLNTSEGTYVLGVDTGADIAEFLYPAYGEPRRVGLAIYDDMIADAGL